jgi:hypothetical protein
MKDRFLLITLAILAMGLFVTSNMRAQDDPQAPVPPQAQPQAQPQPQTAVGRISVIHGNVTTMHGDAGQWTAATVNTPVVPGDSVATADRSRTEVQLDFANIMRLDHNTEAKVADLEQNKINIQLASGLVDYTVYRGTQADAEIDTPNMGVHPLAPGIYRIQVNSDSETLLIVRQGEVEVLTNQGSTKVEAGQIIQIHGTDNPEYKIDRAPGGDDFDRWSSDRDQQIQGAQALQHTGPEVTGAGDLDAYGQWNEVPDYGWCWTPQVDAGWVPYSAGYWGYTPYWGWTWISYEPWGWAPYHYGRWFMYGGGWRWWPGRGFGGHIWSPAYVSFFGFGRGFGFGSIGWLALGPRDVFHPWFGPGHSFSALNFHDIHGAGFIRPGGPAYGSNLERAMTDARMRGAIRNVSAQDFASGRMGRSMPVSEGMLRSASAMRGTLPVAHPQGNLGSRAGSFSGNRSATASGQHFFSRNGTTQAGRTETGAAGARGSSNNYQRFGSGNSSSRWPASVNGGSSASQGRSAPSTSGNRPSWQRFASPNPYSSGRAGSGASTQRGGWQGYSNQSRGYSGGGSRQPLNINPRIMGQRAPSGGYYGGRSSSTPSRTYSAPSSGGSHSSSAPHSSGGGGGHSSGGGHGGGRR